MSLHASELCWKAGQRKIVNGVSLKIETGETYGLLGPNGSGKSSLLKLLAGLRSPFSGAVKLAGKDLVKLSVRDVAKLVAVVEQHATTDTAISVIDVLRLGRTPHRGFLSGWTENDDRIVAEALAQVGLGDRRDQPWHTLSGGERQRVQLARALAQEPSYLILDEPTNHLDIKHQLEILQLVSVLPVTTIVALHDLNLAAMFCDRIGIMLDGQLVANGSPGEVLTSALVQDVFEVRAHIAPSAHHDRLHVQFLPHSMPISSRQTS